MGLCASIVSAYEWSAEIYASLAYTRQKLAKPSMVAGRLAVCGRK